jgi:NADPH-dependent glutamate synthase beta subunit-like oxidoreductase
MPDYEEEVEEALRDGAELHELVAPKRILGSNGCVTGIEMVRMRLGEADDSGRRRPAPVDDSEFVVPCQMVLSAIGQVASTAPAGAIELSRQKTVVADPATLQTSREGLFAGGDVVSGGGSVIQSIAEGQRAAVAMDRHLGGPGLLPPDVSVSIRRASDEELAQARPRLEEPMLPVAQRLGDFREVVCGITPQGACGEANRCLRCDLEKLRS